MDFGLVFVIEFCFRLWFGVVVGLFWFSMVFGIFFLGLGDFGFRVSFVIFGGFF